MATLPKFFKEFNGGKTAFETAGYHNTYANNVVILKGDSAKGEAPCIFTRGMYFPNAESLIAALAFVKGVQISDKKYNAANGGGYIKFEAADPATVVYVENNGVKIGLSSTFVNAHNQVIADVATIKGDYLKASDKQELNSAIEDVRDYVDAEIAKVATSEAFNALTDRVSTLEGEMGAVEGRLDALEPKVSTLIGSDANMSARAIVQDEVAKQLEAEKISDSFDTLKEMAEYLSSHPQDVTKMNEAITQNANDIDAIEAKLDTLATSENLSALENRVKANEEAVATVDSRIEAAEGRVDAKLAQKANAADVYTKDEIDAEFEKVASADNVYTKDEVYTKAEVDEMFAWEALQ